MSWFVYVIHLDSKIDRNKYEGRFKDHPLLPYALSLYYKSLGRLEDLRRCMDYARKAARLVDNYAGIRRTRIKVVS